jgi:hypothetical protein
MSEKLVCRITVRGNKNCGYTVTDKELILCTFHKNKYKKGELDLNDSPCKVPDHLRCVALIQRNGRRCKKKFMFSEDKMCTEHHEMHLEEKGISQYLFHDGETRECVTLNHKSRGSKYPKDKVPIEKFVREGHPNKPYSMCEDCRNYEKKINSLKKEEKLEALKKEELENPESKVRTCHSKYHDIENVSIYPRSQVPKENFLIEVQKGVFKNSLDCKECRVFNRKYKEKQDKRMHEEAKKQNGFSCKMCHYILDHSKRALNNDGSLSRLCKLCKLKEKESKKKRKQELKAIYRSIQREKIEEIGCSCSVCNRIILKPENEDSRVVIKLDTYIKDEERYVDYKGETYLTKDFINKFSDLLEYRVLDLDHLTEKELRERGILKEGEEYLGKQGEVSMMKNEYDMRKEARVTQIACVECHVRVTISREGGRHHKYEEDKWNYILSRKAEGCIFCGFYDPSLLRFLEFNHRNPSQKIACVSTMAWDNKYSYDQLVNEGEKTDVACKCCHRIETSIQRLKGLIPKIRNTEFIKNKEHEEEMFDDEEEEEEMFDDEEEMFDDEEEIFDDEEEMFDDEEEI